MYFICNSQQSIKTMNRALPFIIALLPFCCSGQENLWLPHTTTYTAKTASGYPMSISLYPNGRYDFTTYWGEYHGDYEISIIEDSLDIIRFYDDDFRSQNLYFYSYISFKDTVLAKSYDCFDYYVSMFDLTGEIVPFYSVCFVGSNDSLIDRSYRSDKKQYICKIPPETTKIEMIGEWVYGAFYFKCNYSIDEGNIAFIIGPSSNQYYVSKRRNEIKYFPCLNFDVNANNAVVFKANK